MNLEDATVVSDTGERPGVALAPLTLYARARAYLTAAGIPEPELTRTCVALVANAAGTADDAFDTLLVRAEQFGSAAARYCVAPPAPPMVRKSMKPRPFVRAGSEWRSRLPPLLARLKLLRGRFGHPVVL